jgi:subtilisin-like proprotein convertase family protein
MRGHFEPDFGGAIAIPDGSPAGVTVPVQVFGLASVDTDVVIHLAIDHPRRSDLRVTLTNPATAEVVVFDGLGQSGQDLALSDHVVYGFSGDEMVNGVWYLSVADRAPLQAGTITHLGLTITSRWD